MRSPASEQSAPASAPAAHNGAATRPWLRRLHLGIGIAGVLAFLLTGQYMDRTLDHLAGMPDAPRALYRSGHIYILFSALLNLLLGSYLVAAQSAVIRIVQFFGSTLVMAALGMFLYGFFVETPLAIIERPMIRTGIGWSFSGALLHALCGFAVRRVE